MLLARSNGLESLRWSAQQQRFLLRRRAPSARGITATAVVTLLDGTRVAACFRTK
ncbi:MAG: hypothetical protein ACKOTZ_12900 [Chloroflexota bacterium]